MELYTTIAITAYKSVEDVFMINGLPLPKIEWNHTDNFLEAKTIVSNDSLSKFKPEAIELPKTPVLSRKNSLDDSSIKTSRERIQDLERNIIKNFKTTICQSSQ